LTINCALAQTTGKIAGTVFDAQTNEPLAGANVVVENASMGASVAEDGSFFIINVPTGTYTISVQMIGYETVKIEHFRVSVNRTASIEIDLNPAILEGEVIVVQAEKLLSKKIKQVHQGIYPLRI
jgi:iron complex outermembrane receptor protein